MSIKVQLTNKEVTINQILVKDFKQASTHLGVLLGIAQLLEKKDSDKKTNEISAIAGIMQIMTDKDVKKFLVSYSALTEIEFDNLNAEDAFKYFTAFSELNFNNSFFLAARDGIKKIQEVGK